MRLFSIPEDKDISSKEVLVLIIIAYSFSIICRYIWVFWASSHPEFFWNGQLMLNTSDGYLWAKTAKDILNGFEPAVSLNSPTFLISKIIAFFVRILPFSFETVILWISAFLSSLIVIPLILIARTLKITYVGFTAALIASIAWSYYNRTMVGYCDTDMLNIVLPVFIVWGIIFALKEQKNRYLLITTVTVIIYELWYFKSYGLNLSMAFMFFIYTFIFDRKNYFNYKLLTFFLISLALIPVWIKLSISILLFLFFHFLKEKGDKFVIIILFISVGLVLYTGGFNPILIQLKRYVFKEAMADGAIPLLHYKAVIKTVTEAKGLTFDFLGNRIIGNVYIFILSIIGYVLLLVRFPVLLIFLPFLGFGLLSYGIGDIIPSAGLRFTLYAVPVSAFGISYLIFLIANLLEKYFNKNIKNGFIILSTILILYPNITHIINYNKPTVMNADEVRVLDRLKKISKENDYTVAWWDYGYIIKYYSNTKTLVDGGRNFSKVIFPPSFVLSKDQVSAANMARLAVEYSVKGNTDILIPMMREYKYRDIDKLLKSLSDKNFKLSKKTRDVYIYLSLKMMNKFSTIMSYSNFNLIKGFEYSKPFFHVSSYKERGGIIVDFGNGMKLSKKDGVLILGENKIPIHSSIVTEYDNSMKLRIKKQIVYPNGTVYVIYMKSYNLLLIMDKKVFDSLYIQLFVLDHYNPKLFEPVVISPWSKVYKLKR